MSKYSIKSAFFKNNLLLNEMAIITQTNFVDKIVEIAKGRPQVLGMTSKELESLAQSSVDSDLNIIEKSISREILRCAYKTNLLSLTGKENKKLRKKAEVLMIKQLRKFKNIDGEFIEFKKVLPMFDKIADYLKQSADVSLDNCIKSADLYMRNIFPNSNIDEKKIIEKGEFDFSTVIERSGFYQDYLSTFKQSIDGSEIDIVYEDRDWKIVFPTTPDSFKSYIKSNFDGKLTWCTQDEAMWYNYSHDQFLFIAMYKNNDPTERLDIVSLKVFFDGTIDIEGTCCRFNDPMSEDSLGKYLSDDLKNAVNNKALKYTNLGFGKMSLKRVKQMLSNLAEIRRPNEIVNVLTRHCLSLPKDTYNACKLLITANRNMSNDEIEDILVEFLSAFIFNNFDPDQMLVPGSIRDVSGLDNFITSNVEGINLFNKFKEKILNPRSHPQYIISLLMMDPNFINKENFSFEEFKNAISIAVETNNQNNFKRFLSELGNNKYFQDIFELDKIYDGNSQTSENSRQIIDIILNSKGNKNFVNTKKFSVFNGLNSEREGITHCSKIMSNLYYIKPEKFIEISEEDVSMEDIKNEIISITLADIFYNYKFFKRENIKSQKIVGLDLEEINHIIENIFSDLNTFNSVYKILNYNASSTLLKFAIDHMTSYRQIGINMSEAGSDFYLIFEKLLESENQSLVSILLSSSIDVKHASFITNKSLSIIANSFSNNIDKVEPAIIASATSNNYNILLYVILNQFNQDLKNKTYLKTLTTIFTRNSNVTTKENFIKNIVRKGYDDNQLKEFCFYVLQSKSQNKFDFAILIQSCARNKNIKNEILMKTLAQSISQTKMHTTEILNKLSLEFVTSKECIKLFARSHLQNSDNDTYHSNLEYLVDIFNDNNISFPKNILSNVIANRQSYRGSYSVDSIMANFLTMPKEVRGKDLAIIRNTLIKVFRSPDSHRKYYGQYQYKNYIIQKIKEMPQVARGHMQLVFPELSSEFRAKTPEEKAELDLRAESLLRQYTKMLLS